MTLSEKQQIEKATAEIFLPIFNKRMGTNFEISELGDTPDATCIDRTSGKVLYLEIGLTEDLKGEIADELGRGKTPLASENIMPVRSFSEDAIPNYRKVLEKKMLSSYGPNTALVLRQTAPIWGPNEWRIYAPMLSDLLVGSQPKFGAGIWTICLDSSTFPASHTIYCLNEPS